MRDAAEPSGIVAGRNDDLATTASDHRERRISELKSSSKGKTPLNLPASSQGVQTTPQRQQATTGSAAFRS